jgi:hypothetical protein
MTDVTARPTTRRALLAAALGAAGASVVQALGRPAPAAAINPPMLLNQNNSTSLETSIETSANVAAFVGSNLNTTSGGPNYGVHGYSAGSRGVFGESTSGHGVFGKGLTALYGDGKQIGVNGVASNVDGIGVAGTGSSNGVRGNSQNGIGVMGAAPLGIGVHGESSSGIGVEAFSASGVALSGVSMSGTGVLAIGNSGNGVLAESAGRHAVLGTGLSTAYAAVVGLATNNSAGLQGHSSAVPTDVPAPPAKTGVYGRATQDSTSQGVKGASTAGTGVHGEATSGVGLRGTASTGYALRTSGRVKFDKSGGIATVSAGKTSVLVTPGIDLTSSSAVVATLLSSAGGKTTVHRVAIDATANTFRIYLTAAATGSTKVAWFVFG